MYSAQDLADLVGVPKRTVEYYVKMGVISRALPRSGRYGEDKDKRYTRDHLQQLREVQSILEGNMTLADIRDKLHPQEDEDE